MYPALPSFVLGFHGCDMAVAEDVFAGRVTLRPSENDYDWLGHGIYFWEHNPTRAMDYAKLMKQHPIRNRRGVISTPAVVGAVIDLALCMNLLDAQFLGVIRDGYERLKTAFDAADHPLPRNRPVGPNAELLL